MNLDKVEERVFYEMVSLGRYRLCVFGEISLDDGDFSFLSMIRDRLVHVRIIWA